MFNPYTKAILGAVVAFLGSIITAFDDSVLTTTEIFAAVGIGVGALGAICASHLMIKWLVSGFLAGLGSIGIALQDDKLSWQEVITAASATAVALYAVYSATNTAAKKYADGPQPPPLSS